MNLTVLNITEQKKKQFNKKGIFTAEDLVRFLPRKYNDFTRETGILPETEVSCFVVTVNKVQSYRNRVPMLMAFCTVKSTGKSLLVKWFNQNYLKTRLDNCVGRDVYVAGKVAYSREYNNYAITSPELFEPNISEGKKVYPIYSKIAGMGNEYLADKIKKAVSISELTAETCPYDLVKEQGLLSIQDALYKLHFPATMEQVRKAQERMLFDDLLYFALSNEWAGRKSSPGSQYAIKTLRAYSQLRSTLPYELTDDQRTAVDGMLQHIRDGKRLNALVQGEVGCGKTIIAFLLMAAMSDSGYQSVLMAPTQVLARQHYEDLCKLVEPLGLCAVYLGGAEMPKKEKAAALEKIRTGAANFVVGTHAVIGKGVEYHKLALTIADEEHKFGVAQRAALVEKASEGVHSITMSAIPIPRSLAQVIYGNRVQPYTIRTMPNGRKPVITGIATTKEKLYRFIVGQADKGLQTYVVCPMIEQNEDMEGVKSVEEVSEEYRTALGPLGVRVETLTGRSTKQETGDVIGRFRAGDADVLVATTVIEVGVNVPTATTMVVTNAERFGLSTLHQLRGRVGRSNYQSYCVLESQMQTPESVQRLEAMVSTTDGFKIAEEDLRIRGAGDFLGTKQSGDNKYMALMLAYPTMYAKAQKIAAELLDKGTPCRMLDRVVDESEDAGA